MGSSLNEVVRDLEQHKNSLRIKKMLFCATRSQWENNRDALSSLPMRNLVEEILDLNTTLDQLSVSLYEIVKNVNRQTEYSLVANAIISIVGKLYDDNAESTQVIAFKAQKQDEAIATGSTRTREITRSLEVHPESLRIRKLLYCLGNGEWVNETETLLAANIEELVGQTHQLHPTLARLSLSLQNIVDSLNRKTEYSAVANILIDCFEPLYSDSENDDTTTSTQTPTQTQAPTQPQARQTAVKPRNSVPPTAPLSSPVIATPSPKSLDELSSQLAHNSKSYDPFSVRLEVLKYSNPLRAKILTFSILEHQFDYKGKDWSSLRTIELDRLLLDAYQKYKTLSELETQLHEMAQKLDDQAESLQAAGAIAKAMKPFYQ